MLNLKNGIFIALLLISSSAWSFMPAAGMWGIDSEDNGKPGRGFQIEAENGIIVFTYFGYRPDGSSTFNYASGPIVNNTFTASLLNLQGGTSLGGVHQDAAVIDPAGTVTINFTSGKHGFISLPGEPQRAISKRLFGYADGPDGLLGTWLFTMVIEQTPFSEVRNLSVNVGKSTADGNGIVTTPSSNFACELQISGVLAGMVTCFNYPQVEGAQSYLLKVSGDKGYGLALFQISSTSLSVPQSGYGSRLTTKNGIKTGLNDGTEATLFVKSKLSPSLVPDQAREQITTEKSLSAEDSEKVAALEAWASEAQSIMQPVQ
ncbi:MAG: hypothetical protein ABIR84_09375 [Candidatus Nitrotoga sp.]